MTINSPIKPSIFDLSETDLGTLIASWQEKPYRLKQLLQWLFKERCFDPQSMSNLSSTLRERLTDHFDWGLPQIVEQVQAQDNTTKLLLLNGKGQRFETVIMRYDNRTSLCVSTQVGCKLACKFCQTGKLGFFSHLSAAEIVAQFMIANQLLKPEQRQVTNVVFMGMGEPLDNFENSVKAANIFIERFGLAARHVTISTSGIAPRIVKLAQQSRAVLAISLHAANDSLRTQLMPINIKYPLTDLKDAMKVYQQTTKHKLTIEYILIKNINCQRSHAKELVQFLSGLKTKVNLIPFNPHPGLPFERPSDEEIRQFQKYLADRSIPAPVRYSRGLEVSAACGQLAAKRQSNIDHAPHRINVIQ